MECHVNTFVISDGIAFHGAGASALFGRGREDSISPAVRRSQSDNMFTFDTCTSIQRDQYIAYYVQDNLLMFVQVTSEL